MQKKEKEWILITGISSGIGYFLANELSKEYTVIATVRNENDKLRLEVENPSLVIYIMNMLDSDSIQKAFNQFNLDFPNLKLKAIINNAGYAEAGSILDMSTQMLEAQMKVNFISPMEICKTFFPFLKSNYSRIIQISSISGFFSFPLLGAYCSSKHALEAASDALRRELSLLGIKVILIEPGPLKTKIWQKNLGVQNKYPNSSLYKFLQKGDELVLDSEKNALEVNAILKPILKAIHHSNPKARYLVHKFPIFMKLIKFIPTRWVDYFIYKYMNYKLDS